jgi:hypothetical protein
MFPNNEEAHKFSSLCVLVGLFSLLYGIFLLKPYLMLVGTLILWIGMYITYVYIDNRQAEFNDGIDEDDE